MTTSPRRSLCFALLLTLACGETTPAPSAPAGPASALPPASSSAPVASSARPAASVPAPVASAPPTTAAPALRPIDPAVSLRPDSAPTPPGLATAPTGQLTDVDRMMGRLRSRLRTCFQRQLNVDPAFTSSSMRWELSVDRDGHITRVKYLCKAPLPPDLQRCLEDALRSQDLDPGPRTLTMGECAS